MGFKDIVGLYNPRDSLRSAFDLGYSRCSNKCSVLVGFCRFSSWVSVSSNEVGVVVVLVETTVKIVASQRYCKLKNVYFWPL